MCQCANELIREGMEMDFVLTNARCACLNASTYKRKPKFQQFNKKSYFCILKCFG